MTPLLAVDEIRGIVPRVGERREKRRKGRRFPDPDPEETEREEPPPRDPPPPPDPKRDDEDENQVDILVVDRAHRCFPTRQLWDQRAVPPTHH